jgi:hypothetical protein
MGTARGLLQRMRLELVKQPENQIRRPIANVASTRGVTKESSRAQ